VFVRTAYWFAETFASRWIDRGIIDGILHLVARSALRIGSFFRTYIDLPVVNGFGDFVGEGIKRTGRTFRVVQTGRVQGYLIVGLLFTGLLVSYVLLVKP